MRALIDEELEGILSCLRCLCIEMKVFKCAWLENLVLVPLDLVYCPSALFNMVCSK